MAAKSKSPLKPYIEAINLSGALAAMCTPDPVDVLFGEGAVDFDALPDMTPQCLPYEGDRIDNLVRGLEKSGHAEYGHAVTVMSEKRIEMKHAVRLTRLGREAVREHEALMRAGRKAEALELATRMFSFDEKVATPARAAVKASDPPAC